MLANNSTICMLSLKILLKNNSNHLAFFLYLFVEHNEEIS